MKTNILKPLYRIRKLSVSQRLYFLSLVMVSFSVVHWLSSLVFESYKFPDPTLILSFFLAMFGLMAELTLIYKKLWATTLGKPLLALLALLITNMTVGLSYQMVNAVTTAPPEKFTLTVSTLTILLLPLVVALIVSIGYTITVAIGVLFSPFYGMYWMLKRDFVNTQVMTYYRYFFRPKKNQFKKLTFMCRVYAIVVTAALGKIMMGYAPNYEKNVLKSFVSWHVYTFEMYEQGRCRNTGFKKQLQLTKSTALFSKENVKGFEYVILNCEA